MQWLKLEMCHILAFGHVCHFIRLWKEICGDGEYEISSIYKCTEIKIFMRLEMCHIFSMSCHFIRLWKEICGEGEYEISSIYPCKEIKIFMRLEMCHIFSI